MNDILQQHYTYISKFNIFVKIRNRKEFQSNLDPNTLLTSKNEETLRASDFSLDREKVRSTGIEVASENHSLYGRKQENLNFVVD